METAWPQVSLAIFYYHKCSYSKLSQQDHHWLELSKAHQATRVNRKLASHSTKSTEVCYCSHKQVMKCWFQLFYVLSV